MDDKNDGEGGIEEMAGGPCAARETPSPRTPVWTAGVCARAWHMILHASPRLFTAWARASRAYIECLVCCCSSGSMNAAAATDAVQN